MEMEGTSRAGGTIWVLTHGHPPKDVGSHGLAARAARGAYIPLSGVSAEVSVSFQGAGGSWIRVP